MLRNYNLYLRRLNLIFEKKILDAARNFDKSDKKIISEHMTDIYNRWFYSVSQNNCSITPANIFASISNGENIFSRIKKISGNKITSEPVFYSLDDHPVVNDLRIIIKNFVYIYDLQLEFDPDNKDVKKILSMISIHETGYLDYLKTICFYLGIFEIMPSIYCQRLCLSKDASAFIEKSSPEIFDLVFDTTMTIFYENLCSLLCVPSNQCDFGFVMDLFYMHDNSSNKIINKIIKHLEVDWALFISIDKDNFFRDYSYYLNVLVNRFFINNFGHYLKLFLPIYNQPLNLDLLLSVLKKTCGRDKKDKKEFYYVFDYGNTSFILTDIGKKYLDIKSMNMFSNISQEEINFLVNNFGNIKQKTYPNQRRLCGYVFKIEIQDNQEYWKIIRCNSLMTLHEFFLIICEEFSLSNDSKYSFSNKTNPNPNNNTYVNSSIKLNQLNIIKGDSFFLKLYDHLNYYTERKSKLVETCICLKISLHDIKIELENIFGGYIVVC